MQLYPHQDEVIAKARYQLRQHQSVVIRAPTGFGKTVLSGFMAKRAIDKGLRVWFICHRRELVTQTCNTFRRNNLPHGVVMCGSLSGVQLPLLVCSVKSLANRIATLPAPDLVIWDECHHLAAKTWSLIMEAIPKAKHVGLTATPERLDGKGLDPYFASMVEGKGEAWLISNGYLSDYRVFAPPGLDSNDNRRVGNVLAHYKKYSAGLKTIIFAHSIAESKRIAQEFTADGIGCAHLDGKTNRSLRDDACRQFARGGIDALTNVGLFDEGFDISSLINEDATIESAILAAPTGSFARHRQQLGRVLRPKPNSAVIIDMVGNIIRHGLPDDEVEWSLTGKNKVKRSEGDEGPPVRQCLKCYANHRWSPVCPNCGHVYPVQERKLETTTGELEEIDKEQLRRRRKWEQRKAQSLDDLVALGRSRNYKNPEKWAAKIYTYRQAKKNAGNMEFTV